MTHVLITVTLLLAIIGWFKSDKPSRKVSWSVVCLLVLGGLAQCYIRWDESVESGRLQARLDTLSQQNDTLLIQNDQLYLNNQRLLERIAGYQDSLEMYNRGIESIKAYSDVSKMNRYGDSYDGTNFGLSTSITALMDSICDHEGSYTKCICSQEAIDRLNRVIDKEPRFPFSYYMLSLCYREKGDSMWVSNAKKAKSIFEHTIEISGHHKSHDQALDHINQLLRDADIH